MDQLSSPRNQSTTSVSSETSSTSSNSTVASASGQSPQQQQQQQLVVVSSSGSNAGLAMVTNMHSGISSSSVASSVNNTVVFSPQTVMASAAGSATVAQTQQLVSQAQNSIRMPAMAQQQQQFVMAPMGIFNGYLPTGHQVVTSPAAGQFIIQNVPLQNQSIFQLPAPPASNQQVTTIGNNRRSSNIQPRPPNTLLPAPTITHQATATAFRSLAPQIISQTSPVSQANIQPRPQFSLPTSLIRTSAPQFVTQPTFQQINFPNQSGLGWTIGQSGGPGYILRPQDPIQFLPSQTPLLPFVQSNVQVPSTPAPIVPMSPAAVQTTNQVATSSTSTPNRFKPIATRPSPGSSLSTQTQSPARSATSTTSADTTKLNSVRSKQTPTASAVRSAPASTSTPKPSNGPSAPARDAETSTVTRSSPVKTPSSRSEVSSSNTANNHVPTPVNESVKNDSKPASKPIASTPLTSRHKESSHSDGKQAEPRNNGIKRPHDRRETSLRPEATPPPPGPPVKKPDPNRLRNGVKPVTETKKQNDEKSGPEILIHVIEDFVIEESSKPFPVNGSTDHLPLSENGSCGRSDTGSNRSISPDDRRVSTPRSRQDAPDAGVCQSCLKSGPKSRLKLKNGARVCGTCFSKKPVTVTTSAVSSSAYDFDDDASQQQANETSVKCPETTNESKKKLRTSAKKVPATSSVPVQAIRVDPVPQKDNVSAPVDPISPETRSEIAGLFIPESGRDPYKWNVQDVYDFVRHLEGCEEHADEFKSQEIDGYALMLLKEDHLMSAMKMRLGPALKICSKINALKREAGNRPSS